MDMQIRRAGLGDATALALLGRITFAETFGYLFREHEGDLRAYLDATFDVGKIENSLAKPENAYWLVLRDRLPIGYAKLKHPSPPPAGGTERAAQLQKIYILSAFLGRSIGRDLLRHVVDAAAGMAPVLWLDVLHENERAIRFYRKHGFEPSGRDTYTIGAQRFLFQIMTRRTA